jgi:5-methylcytosine-specific restriction endonuclease McrA
VSNWENGSSAAWRAMRLFVLDRDKHRCQIRTEGTWVNRKGQTLYCLVKATHVHHTRDRRVVGDDPAYLVAACAPCNLHVGDPTKGDPAPTPATRW